VEVLPLPFPQLKSAEVVEEFVESFFIRGRKKP